MAAAVVARNWRRENSGRELRGVDFMFWNLPKAGMWHQQKIGQEGTAWGIQLIPHC
jgi:hypothetical protein